MGYLSKTKIGVRGAALAGAIALTLGMTILSGCSDVGCQPRYSWLNSEDMPWEQLPFVRVDAPAEAVFAAAQSALRAEGFTICNSLVSPSPANLSRPCIGACGQITSLRNGFVVADRILLGRATTRMVKDESTGRFREVPADIVSQGRVRVYLGFRETGGTTQVALAFGGGIRVASPETPGYRSATAPSASVKAQRTRARLERSLLGAIARAAGG